MNKSVDNTLRIFVYDSIKVSEGKTKLAWPRYEVPKFSFAYEYGSFTEQPIFGSLVNAARAPAESSVFLLANAAACHP